MNTRMSEVDQDATRTDFGHRVVLVLCRLPATEFLRPGTGDIGNDSRDLCVGEHALEGRHVTFIAGHKAGNPFAGQFNQLGR